MKTWEESAGSPHVLGQEPGLKRLLCIVIGLGLSAACASAPATPAEMAEFRSGEVPFVFDYPKAWGLTIEGPQRIVLAAPGESDWQPAAPADIPKDPRIWVDYGAGIGERLGAAALPPDFDSDSLRAWLEQKVAGGTAEDLSERTINGATAFELSELSVPGCQQVVYWGPGDLDHLVRLATGCQSPRLAAFEDVADSLQAAR
jgi:hypothetical protein